MFADLLNKYAVPFLNTLARIAKFVAYFSKGLFTGLFTEISKVTPAFKEIGRAILKILGALKRLAPIIATVVAAFYGFNALSPVVDFIGHILNYFGLYPAAIALVTGAIGTLVLNFKNLFDTTKSYTEIAESLGNKIGEIFGGMVNLVVGGIKNILTVIAELLNAISQIPNAILHPIETFKKLMSGTAEFVAEKMGGENVSKILGKWEGMFGGITKHMNRFTRKTKVAGQQTEADLSHNSPGPTYMIRKKWFEMLDMIGDRVEDFTSFTKKQGQKIQSAVTISPQVSLGDQTQSLRNQFGVIQQIQQAQADSVQNLGSNGLRGALVSINSLMSNFSGQLKPSLFLLNEFVDAFVDIKTLLPSLQMEMINFGKAVAISNSIAAGTFSDLAIAMNSSRSSSLPMLPSSDRSNLPVLASPDRLNSYSSYSQSDVIDVEFRVLGTEPIPNISDGVQGLDGGLQGLRGTLISVGSLLSNFAPELATPLFVLNDFIDAFVDIKALLPTLEAGVLAWGNSIAASNSFVGGTFTLLKSAALKAYTTLLVPILPFLPIILGVIAAVGLFYLAFKSNFLGIRDLIYGVGWAFKKFFGDLFGGFIVAIGSIFTTIDREVRAIASIFGELVSTVISIFDPILKLFNVDVSNSVLSLSDVLSAVVNALLFPIRILVKSLNFLITSISWGIQLIIKSLIFTVNVIKTILSFTWELIKSVSIIGATIGGIVAVLNFGAVLAGIVSAFSTIVGLVGSISVILSGIISGIVFVTPFLITGVASVLTMIGGAITGIAIALVPYLPIILLISGVCAVIIGIAFVIKKIFEGIWWVISSIAKGLWYIITNPMQAFSNIVTFVQDVFSGISSAVVGLFNGLKAIGSFIGGLFLKIGQGIGTVVGWIMTPVTILANAISSLFSLLSNPLGFLSGIPIIGGLFGGQPKTEKPPGYATGGLVEGSGTSTGDRIHAKLSPGEYVINASSTKANLPLLDAINTDKASVISTPQITKITDNTPIPAEVNGIAFEVEKIFEGISQVISSIGKGIWDIITNPMQALANIGTFIQDVFSGILNTALGFIGVVESVGTIFWQIFSVVKLVVDIISIFNPAILLARTGFMLGFLTLNNINSVIEIFKTVWQILSPIVKVIWDIFVKSLVVTVDIIKVILPFVWELVKSILIIGATIGGIFAVLNFGAVLAGIVSAFATIAGLVGSIGVIFGGIVSGVMFITPLLITGVASVLTMIGGAVTGIAIAIAPILPVILLISGVCAAIIGVAFVIKKIFEGIWWVISSVVNSISSIPFIGGLFGGQPKTEKPPGYATGGLVKGPGTGTGDRIHAKLSPGEYVINAIAAKANLPLLHSINAARAGMMPTPQIMAMPAFAPIPFFPPTQSESAGEQEFNINLSFGDIIVNGDSGDDLARDFIDKLRSPQVKMEIRQIMREFVERMR